MLIRLMTHNIWNQDNNAEKWAEKGMDCSASARVGGLLRVYRETLPDVIGCQEASSMMADLLKQGFEGDGVKYTLIWGRYTPIIYRQDKLELIDSEFGTFPENINGFEGSFNDVKSKSWNLGVFRIKENGEIFIFVTTHLWWKKSPGDGISHSGSYQEGSDEARESQVATVVAKIEEYRRRYCCPAVLVGDMNTGYDSKAMTYVRAQGFCHAHDIATDYAEEAVGYHYCFHEGYEERYYDRPFETAIDHIYVIGEKQGSVKRFERYSPEYYLPISDHSPAYIDIEI